MPALCEAVATSSSLNILSHAPYVWSHTPCVLGHAPMCVCVWGCVAKSLAEKRPSGEFCFPRMLISDGGAEIYPASPDHQGASVR